MDVKVRPWVCGLLVSSALGSLTACSNSSEEVAALRDQVEELQAQLDATSTRAPAVTEAPATTRATTTTTTEAQSTKEERDRIEEEQNWIEEQLAAFIQGNDLITTQFQARCILKRFVDARGISGAEDLVDRVDADLNSAGRLSAFDADAFLEPLVACINLVAIMARDLQIADPDLDARCMVKGLEESQVADWYRTVYVEGQEALAVSGENMAQAEIANANADLKEAEAGAKQRADVATAQSEAAIQRAFAGEEEERLKASEIVRENIQKQQIEIAAEAEAERQRRIARGEADAILAVYEAEAKGVQQVLEAKAKGYQNLVNSAAGDPKAAATLLMVEKIESMVSAQAEAIRNLKIDKVTVWDGGNNDDGSSATSNFVSSLVQSLPPIHDVAKMAGVDLPDYLGSMSEDEDGE